MKNWNKLLAFLVLIGVVFVSGCFQQKNGGLSEKYCKVADDCLTSCGSRGGSLDAGSDCYNKEYVRQFWDESGKPLGSANSPIDEACCSCDVISNPYECVCKKNTCTAKRI